jgi:U6 snRNA-associated Sm-like protein LSm7
MSLCACALSNRPWLTMNFPHLTVKGTLKGYDALMNLVLDDVEEIMRDDEGNESTRSLGLVVARGTLLVLVSPVDGSEEIANPFLNNED